MTLVMGIVNVTPDSFSDGGRWSDPEQAIAHGIDLVAQGADLLDVGGESTRPGAQRVSEAEELRRVVPVVTALSQRGATVSVDTMRPSVAAACAEAGAAIINDVSGGLADPQMLTTCAQLDVDVVLMHWRAHSATMQDQAHYDDVVGDVVAELTRQRDLAVAAGIPPERIIVDPGLGFSKTAEHNWELLRHLDAFQSMGHRVLVGASRKRFLGEVLQGRAADQRDPATAMVSGWCAAHRIWAVRTHEVALQRDAIAVGHQLAWR